MNLPSLDLARSVERDAARVDRLMEDVARSMLSGAGPLTDQQRALMWGVVTDIVRSVHRRIAAALGEAVADGRAPSAVAACAADAVTGPSGQRVVEIVARSAFTRDTRLVRLVFARIEAHRLAEVMRPPGSAGPDPESNGILDRADLDRCHDQQMAHLDEYGDPRLPLDDLPPDMVEAIHWQVAAALRVLLIETEAVDLVAADDAIEAAVASVLHQPAPLPEAERQDRQAAIPPEALVRALKRGDVFLFLMLLGQISGLALGRLQAMAFGRGTLEFATLCRAIDVQRTVFAELHLLVGQHSSGKVRDPRALAEAMHAFDGIDPDEARDLLRLWRRHPRYAGAIRRITDG